MSDRTPQLHAWEIPAREYARHEARRGRRFAYETLDPARTALIVIDMVHFFVENGPLVQGIVPNINRLAASLRAAGGTVAWIVPAVSDGPSAHDIAFYGEMVAAAYAQSGGEGTIDERLWSGLDVHADDLRAEKTASSAFFPGRSPLPDLLAARDIDTVLITGTVTNVCCESSARDASTLGYRVIMVADGNATVNDAMHNATLTTIYRSFGDVRTTDDLLALIAAGDR